MIDNFSQYWLYRHDAVAPLNNELSAKSISLMSNAPNGMTIEGGIAIIDVVGPITTYPSFFGVSVEILKSNIALALATPKVNSILLNIDSPGSSAIGATNFSDWLKQVSEIKPVYSYCVQACSGALLLATATRKLFAGDMSVLGSVGVIYRSRKDDTQIVIRSENAPLKTPDGSSKDGKDAIQTFLNDLERVFIGRLAVYSGISEKEIREKWGRGNVLTAENALHVGMIDKILTFEQTIREIKEMANDKIVGQGEVDSPGVKVDSPGVFVKADVEEMIASALTAQKGEMRLLLEEMESKHQEEMQKTQAEIVEANKVEVLRKQEIDLLFSMFNRETQYALPYSNLKAACLADPTIDYEKARAKIIQLQGSFSPIQPQTLAQVPTPIGEDLRTLDDIAFEIMKTQGLSHAKAYLAAIKGNKEAHERFIAEKNQDVFITWKET